MTRLFHWPCNARTIDLATRLQQSTRWAIVNCNCNKGQCDDSQETATKCNALAIQEMQLNKAFSPRSPSKFSAMPWTCTIPPSTPTEMTWELLIWKLTFSMSEFLSTASGSLLHQPQNVGGPSWSGPSVSLYLKNIYQSFCQLPFEFPVTRCGGFENWSYSIQNIDGSSVKSCKITRCFKLQKEPAKNNPK